MIHLINIRSSETPDLEILIHERTSILGSFEVFFQKKVPNVKQIVMNDRLNRRFVVQTMFKELITKFLTIALVLGALHATAGGINPGKVNDSKSEKTAVVESDSTKVTLDESPASKEKLSEKVSEKAAKVADGDNGISSTESSSSIVTFNFVYYLLEKFKFSDLLGR